MTVCLYGALIALAFGNLTTLHASALHDHALALHQACALSQWALNAARICEFEYFFIDYRYVICMVCGLTFFYEFINWVCPKLFNVVAILVVFIPFYHMDVDFFWICISIALDDVLCPLFWNLWLPSMATITPCMDSYCFYPRHDCDTSWCFVTNHGGHSVVPFVWVWSFDDQNLWPKDSLINSPYALILAS